MNVSQAYYIVNTLRKDKFNVPEIIKEEFNDLLLFSNDSYFTRLFAQKKAEAEKMSITFEEYLSKDEDFRPLKKTETIALTTGVGNLPSDYHKYIYVRNASIGATVVQSHVDIVSDKELIEGAYNVFGLMEYHPKIVIDGASIKVLPSNITSIGLTYIKNPATPVYGEAYNATSGLNEYAAGSSTQWEWGERNHVNILLEIFNLMNLSVSLDDVKKYVEK